MSVVLVFAYCIMYSSTTPRLIIQQYFFPNIWLDFILKSEGELKDLRMQCLKNNQPRPVATS